MPAQFFLDLEDHPAVAQSINAKLTDTYRPLVSAFRILVYLGEAFISWHTDATGVSYDTPTRIQEATPVPDVGTECRSEVIFSTTTIQGHHEFDKEVLGPHKIYNRKPNVVTLMAVDCVASGSSKRLSPGCSNPLKHSACSVGDWVLFIWPSHK